MLLAAEGDYRKVGNGTTTRALRFVSILKSHHSSNRAYQGHGKRRNGSGRSCLSAFATACTTAWRMSAGICATAASSRYSEASARRLSARSRRSEVRRTTLNESLMARQTVRCGLRALPSGAPINRDHACEHERKASRTRNLTRRKGCHRRLPQVAEGSVLPQGRHSPAHGVPCSHLAAIQTWRPTLADWPWEPWPRPQGVPPPPHCNRNEKMRGISGRGLN